MAISSGQRVRDALCNWRTTDHTDTTDREGVRTILLSVKFVQSVVLDSHRELEGLVMRITAALDSVVSRASGAPCANDSSTALAGAVLQYSNVWIARCIRSWSPEAGPAVSL